MSRLTNWLRSKNALPKKEQIPEHVSAGRESYGFGAASFHGCDAESPVEIGAFCSFGPDVLFLCKADHPTETVSTFPMESRFFGPNSRKATRSYLRSKGPIRVGNDVWAGARVTILSGVTIGNGAIIAAGSVVTRDVPPYALTAGVPAKVKRIRFDAVTVAALQEIQWWNWPAGRLKAERAAFSLPAEEFARRFSTPKLVLPVSS
jgi:acetyltransferase-like isoleucine patch superfamily enzyme